MACGNRGCVATVAARIRCLLVNFRECDSVFEEFSGSDSRKWLFTR